MIKESTARLQNAIMLLYCIKALCHSLICITCNLLSAEPHILGKACIPLWTLLFQHSQTPLPFTGTFSARQHQDNSSATLLRPAAIYVCWTTTVSVEVVLSSWNNLILSDFCMTMGTSELAQTSHKSHKMLSLWVKTGSFPWILLLHIGGKKTHNV